MLIATRAAAINVAEKCANVLGKSPSKCLFRRGGKTMSCVHFDDGKLQGRGASFHIVSRKLGQE